MDIWCRFQSSIVIDVSQRNRKGRIDQINDQVVWTRIGEVHSIQNPAEIPMESALGRHKSIGYLSQLFGNLDNEIECTGFKTKAALKSIVVKRTGPSEATKAIVPNRS